MLALIGPLVGVSFIAATRTYAEASGLGGAAGGLADALWPLDGILVPTLSAYEIAALFLLPFVAIRMIAGDRQSGALKLELQHSLPSIARLGAKMLVLLAGWSIASVPALIAFAEWRAAGGSIYLPELGSVLLGHLLNAGVVIALAAAAASVAEHPSTAAILTLAFTVGTWVLNFLAAVHGGLWERLARYTPAEMLQAFQRGQVRLALVLAAFAAIAAGLGLASVWMRLGVSVRRRAAESIGIVAAASVLMFGCSRSRTDWDVSENRRNSFSESDERLLKQIQTPLHVEAHLAPEDPRRFDLERQTLSKLRRSLPHVTVRYVAATSSGLFEQANLHYGEIWYELGGRRAMTRVTSSENALETIYALAGMPPPKEEQAEHRGHPLVARPAGAALIFYGIWPLLAAGVWIFIHRRFV
ncbi:MAG: hypothetical protein LAP38_18310 [Acidobacteriia bacterium]|nr:hypothetical protein [Terriglobia bacterium]